MEKEIKVLINVHDNLEVDVERLKVDLLNRISNPIDLAKYVNFWEHSRECFKPLFHNDCTKYNKEMDDMYHKICIRLKERYTKEKNACVKYHFSPYNWNMVVEIGRTYLINS